METLKGNTCYLRALEPEDLEFLFDMENKETHWKVSGTIAPFSRYILKQYLENAHKDIYEVKQLRLVIAENDTAITLGMIDLFDFEPVHKRAGIGILLAKAHRGKGYASEALELLCKYAFKYLGLHQVYANITTDNKTSLHLFEQREFKLIGIKKEWIKYKETYLDEATYQRIAHNKD